MTARVLPINPLAASARATAPFPTAPPGAYGLVGYSAEIAAEIYQFQKEVFPYRRTDWIAPRWNWMFLESAARLGVKPMVWLFRSRAGVVGHQGGIPVQVKTGQTERITGWFVETAVLDSVRGKAIGPMVITKAKKDLPFNLSLGQTPEMRAIQFAVGWHQVCPLNTYLFVLDADQLLQARCPNRWIRAGAACALTAFQGAKSRVGRRRLRWTPQVREIDRFDQAHTRLWNDVKDEYPCAVVRDASYLNWKYVDQPGQHFIRLGIERDGALVGIVILNLLGTSDVRTYRRGVIVDLVVRPSDRDAVWALLDASRKTLLRRGAALMAIDLASVSLVPAVRSFGFFGEEPNRVFLVSCDGLEPEAEALVRSPHSWLVTGGDSDIDRPW